MRSTTGRLVELTSTSRQRPPGPCPSTDGRGRSVPMRLTMELHLSLSRSFTLDQAIPIGQRRTTSSTLLTTRPTSADLNNPISHNTLNPQTTTTSPARIPIRRRHPRRRCRPRQPRTGRPRALPARLSRSAATNLVELSLPTTVRLPTPARQTSRPPRLRSRPTSHHTRTPSGIETRPTSVRGRSADRPRSETTRMGLGAQGW